MENQSELESQKAHPMSEPLENLDKITTPNDNPTSYDQQNDLQDQINQTFKDENDQQNQSQQDNQDQQMTYNAQDYENNENLNYEIFGLFDLDGSGKIDINDLEEIGKAMGWKKQEVDDLIFSLDPNHDGKISFEEFQLVMKHIEERIQNNNQRSQQSSQNLVGQPSKMLGDQQTKMYGALLPKTGVYFLPDEKIIGFLKQISSIISYRILNELRKKYERDGNYTKAKILKYKFDTLSNQEQQRQQLNMRIAQEQELSTVENAQKLQFTEFAEAWDKYMTDYEAAAFESVERLKEKHIKEIKELHERVKTDFMIKFKWTRELLDLRKQEKIHFSVKDYINAEECKRRADIMELQEREMSQNSLNEAIGRQEKILRQKQQMALATLLKRIQRDREEQLKHRQEDSQRLMQRNTNLLKDMITKQAQEQRKTSQFLKFALGKRENKTEEEIKQMIKDSTYQPNSDPLMGRINRKYNPTVSVYSNVGRGRLYTQDSRTSKHISSRIIRPFEFQSPQGPVGGLGAGRENTLVQRKLNIRKINQTAILEEVHSTMNDINSFRKHNQPSNQGSSSKNQMSTNKFTLPKIKN